MESICKGDWRVCKAISFDGIFGARQGEKEGCATRDSAEVFQQAIEAGRRRDYAKAVELLTRLVGTSDGYPQALLYLGRSYHALGELEKAVRALDSYVRLKPDSAAGHFFLGRSLIALEMYPAAIRSLREAVERNPGFSQAYGLLGFACLKARRPERSLAFFRKALELDPASKSLLAGLLNATLVAAIKLFYHGRLIEAAGLFDEILRLRGPAMAPHLYLATIYRELGEGEKALFHIDAACRISPEDPLLHLQKSLVLLDLGRKTAAGEEIRAGTAFLKTETAVGQNPDEILRIIAVRRFSEGRYKEAIFSATKLLKGAYDDPQLHALVAEAYRNLGDYVKARNHYLRAIESDRESLEIRYALLAVLWELGEHGELLSHARRILKNHPADPVALYFNSLALARTGAPAEEAITALQQQIRVKGPDPLLMSALAGTYLKAGLPELAEGWFIRTLKVSADDGGALLALASIYDSLRNREKLKGVYARYLDLNPEDRKTRRALVRILLELEDFADAAVHIARLLPSEPKNGRLKSMLALCFRRSGKYSDALIILKDLLREKPDSEELVKAVVYCLDKLGARNIGIQVIEGFLKVHGEKLSLLLMLGVLHFQEKAMEKSAETFRRAISLSPRDWRAYRNLGMVYRKMGNGEFATTFLSRAEEYRRAAGVES
jgi:tetratricopeptide (TPR) repeat protein